MVQKVHSQVNIHRASVDKAFTYRLLVACVKSVEIVPVVIINILVIRIVAGTGISPGIQFLKEFPMIGIINSPIRILYITDFVAIFIIYIIAMALP
jgi:hypothetical protein